MSDFVFDKGETSRIEQPDVSASAGTDTGGAGGLGERIVEALRTVYDPEIPVNIYELGLIYRIDIAPDQDAVEIDMTLTAPGCPVAGSMPGMVEHAVRGAIPELKDVTVELVWDPPWTPDRLSEAARLELGMF